MLQLKRIGQDEEREREAERLAQKWYQEEQERLRQAREKEQRLKVCAGAYSIAVSPWPMPGVAEAPAMLRDSAHGEPGAAGTPAALSLLRRRSARRRSACVASGRRRHASRRSAFWSSRRRRWRRGGGRWR